MKRAYADRSGNSNAYLEQQGENETKPQTLGSIARRVDPVAQTRNAAFLQPFLSYTTRTATTFTLNTETTCDWENVAGSHSM